MNENLIKIRDFFCNPINRNEYGIHLIRNYGSRRRYWLIQKKYGIDQNEFETYWLASRGQCYLCEKNMKMPDGKNQNLNTVNVDHDHLTGKFRGLLCNACNTALGMFKDDPQILKKSITYLEEHEKTSINTKNYRTT